MADTNQDNTESSKQAYYIDEHGVMHNLGIRDLMYLPDLELKSLAPKIEESVDKYGNMSWRSTFTVKVATQEQVNYIMGVDMGLGDSKTAYHNKPENKVSEEMDF